MAEMRIGFGFNNPDLTSDHYAPGWGKLVTPDELRYIVMFGVKLVASDAAQTYTDDNLQYYIDHAVGIVEADLQIDLYPRIVRHNDPIDTTTGARIPRTDIDPGERNQVREPGYPYKTTLANYYMFTKLRRRPLQEVLLAKLVDPVQSKLIDIYPWRREMAGLEARVQFFPQIGTTMIGLPFISQSLQKIRYPLENFPEALLLDYRTGWPNASAIPTDVRELTRKLAGIMLMSDYGDGRSAAVASQSASLNSISESFTTTMSATNAMYGARIIEWQKWIKTWWGHNAKRYQRNPFGVL
jgi:hypothetical protein